MDLSRIVCFKRKTKFQQHYSILPQGSHSQRRHKIASLKSAWLIVLYVQVGVMNVVGRTITITVGVPTTNWMIPMAVARSNHN
jgi:hypothetical protein